ncbi:hypothetical protein PV04_00648 [Phialophora macrospora]|uniref:Uncharacterized protein n=1 Tax=Phialophora macrospora TaxID=1851006 RepID=A0A0D2EDT7_9EURO|nr:hypothetical protein PV04_00648 [Phialophora macrospora]
MGRRVLYRCRKFVQGFHTTKDAKLRRSYNVMGSSPAPPVASTTRGSQSLSPSWKPLSCRQFDRHHQIRPRRFDTSDRQTLAPLEHVIAASTGQGTSTHVCQA